MAKRYNIAFNTESEYTSYNNSTGFCLPNVSYIKKDNVVHYNPFIDTSFTVKYNVTDTSSPTKIGYNQYISGFSEIAIDGVVQSSVVSAYTFSTTGEHTVKYTLTNSLKIDSNSFKECINLTSVNIPNGIVTIGSSVFYGCSSLTSITIADSVKTIDANAFNSCSGLTNVDIPSGVTTIGTNAFYRCIGLTNIVIPDSVTSINYGILMNCSGLTSVTIGSGVTFMGNYLFDGCSSLTTIISKAINPARPQDSTFDGINTSGTLYIPQGSTENYGGWSWRLDGWTIVEQ